jgi:hypothetical protein
LINCHRHRYIWRGENGKAEYISATLRYLAAMVDPKDHEVWMIAEGTKSRDVDVEQGPHTPMEIACSSV